VTREIDSTALLLLNRALGLSGSPASATELEDGHVTQTIDVGPIARRSLPIGGGLWYARLACAHTGVGDLNTSFDPYNATHATPGSLVKSGFPLDVPAGFDIWVISCIGLTDDATDFAAAAFDVETAATAEGISILNTAGVVSSPAAAGGDYPYAVYDGVFTAAAAALYLTKPDGTVLTQINQRIRRGQLFHWRSTSDTAGTVTNTVLVCMGLFPEALGQDAAF